MSEQPVMTIIQDTREQIPLTFESVKSDLIVEVGTVPIYDYCLKGDWLFAESDKRAPIPRFAIERKGFPDFMTSFTTPSGQRAEIAKIKKAREYFYKDAPHIYVIEGKLTDIALKKYYTHRNARMNSERAYTMISNFIMAHGIIPIFATNQEGAEKMIHKLLKQRWEMLVRGEL